jgi:hypothetical protein
MVTAKQQSSSVQPRSLPRKEDDKPKASPRVLRALLKAFDRGALGHVLTSHCPPEHEHLLNTWLERHGGETFPEWGETLLEDGKPDTRIRGIYACFCETCLPFATKFVLTARIGLIAQGAGEYDLHWTSDDRVLVGEPRRLSVAEAETECRIAESCCTLALAICEDVALEVATQVAQQVAHKVARSTAQEVARQIAGDYSKRVTRQMLINQAGLEQSLMLNGNSGGS